MLFIYLFFLFLVFGILYLWPNVQQQQHLSEEMKQNIIEGWGYEGWFSLGSNIRFKNIEFYVKLMKNKNECKMLIMKS